MIYSFDVFDTCLTRSMARPADVFWMLGGKILAHLGKGTPTLDELTDFRLQRMRAEQVARSKRPKGEVLLADIYAEFDWMEKQGLSRERGMQAEIETEHELIRPIAAARQRIRQARESGARIVFISDMYLPSPVLGSWLVDHGMALPEDPVYVSGEEGASKRSGELFRRVGEKEEIEFRNWRLAGVKESYSVVKMIRKRVPVEEEVADGALCDLYNDMRARLQGDGTAVSGWQLATVLGWAWKTDPGLFFRLQKYPNEVKNRSPFLYRLFYLLAGGRMALSRSMGFFKK